MPAKLRAKTVFVGQGKLCSGGDRPARLKKLSLGRCGGDRPARLKKLSLSGGPQSSTRAEPTMSPEISPKALCQRLFGSSKHQGRVKANAKAAQRFRHCLASAAWRARQLRPVLSSSALPASLSKKQPTNVALPVRSLTHLLVASSTAALVGFSAPHCGAGGIEGATIGVPGPWVPPDGLGEPPGQVKVLPQLFRIGPMVTH